MIKKVVGILIVGLLMLFTVSIIAQEPETTENQVITQTNKKRMSSEREDNSLNLLRFS
jgi:hypothetical protein